MANFIFDLDGTVVKQGQPISQHIANELIALSKEHEIIFASARPVRDMLPLLPAELVNSLLIGCNGGMAWQGNSCLISNNFADDILVDILQLLSDTKTPYVIDGNWAFCCSDANVLSNHLPTITHEFHEYIRSLSNEEGTAKDIVEDGVTKVLILDGSKKALFENFTSNNNLCINHHRHDDLFDITPAKDNKYDTLKKLKISVEESIVFGNDSNDFKMLEHAKISVFVGDKNLFDKANYYCSIENIHEFIRNIAKNH